MVTSIHHWICGANLDCSLGDWSLAAFQTSEINNEATCPAQTEVEIRLDYGPYPQSAWNMMKDAVRYGAGTGIGKAQAT
jgi:hypothetical protein